MKILSDSQFPVTYIDDEMWGHKWFCVNPPPHLSHTYTFESAGHVFPLSPFS